MGQFEEMFSLKGRTVLLTGGAGFLGSQYCIALISAGANVIVVDFDEKKLKSLKTTLTTSELSRTLFCHNNILDKEQMRSVLQNAVSKFGKIDILINNAANNPTMSKPLINSRFETMSLDEWARDIDVGITGAFICSQVFGFHMNSNRNGLIINIASDLGVIAPDQRLYIKDGENWEDQSVKPVTYSVCKSAVIGLTRYLSTYWINNNVRSNALVIGGMYNEQDNSFVERINKLIPMGRMAKHGEYSASIVYMCSDAASYMNGSIITIDGGRTAW